MKVRLQTNRCIVIREPGDPGFYGNLNAAGESKLLHHVKKELNKQGFDFIKKRMWKDGHMVDDMQQYLRERKPVFADGIKRQLCIYSTFWQIRGANDDFNKGRVVFGVENIAKEG